MRWMLALSLLLSAWGGPAGGGLARADSIFFVDGLAVDPLDAAEEQEEEAKEFFSAQMHRFPLADPRRPTQAFSLSPLPPTRATSPEIRSLASKGAALEHVANAERYVEAQHWNQARLEIEKALTADPGNVYLLRRAAALAALAGKYAVADGYFRRAIEADPENVAFLAGWAGVLIRLQRFDEADGILVRAEKLAPKDLTVRFHRTTLQILTRNMDGIEEDWDSARPPQIRQLAGWLAADRADLEKVLAEEGFVFLADVVLGLGSHEHLTLISELTGTAMTAMRNRQWLEAAHALDRLSQMGLHSYWPSIYLADCYQQMAESERALTLLLQVGKQHPDSVVLWFNTGYLLVKLQRYPQAIAAFQRARKLSPDYKEAAFALACAYAGNGELDKAWPILEELVAWNRTAVSSWMEGDAVYLIAIRNDARYLELFPLLKQGFTPPRG